MAEKFDNPILIGYHPDVDVWVNHWGDSYEVTSYALLTSQSFSTIEAAHLLIETLRRTHAPKEVNNINIPMGLKVRQFETEKNAKWTAVTEIDTDPRKEMFFDSFTTGSIESYLTNINRAMTRYGKMRGYLLNGMNGEDVISFTSTHFITFDGYEYFVNDCLETVYPIQRGRSYADLQQAIDEMEKGTNSFKAHLHRLGFKPGVIDRERYSVRSKHGASLYLTVWDDSRVTQFKVEGMHSGLLWEIDFVHAKSDDAGAWLTLINWLLSVDDWGTDTLFFLAFVEKFHLIASDGEPYSYAVYANDRLENVIPAYMITQYESDWVTWPNGVHPNASVRQRLGKLTMDLALLRQQLDLYTTMRRHYIASVFEVPEFIPMVFDLELSIIELLVKHFANKKENGNG